MRFNPKADLDTGRIGDAGGSGGGGLGGGPMRIPLPGGAKGGGGIGMILVIVLIFVLSQCMGGNGLPGGTPADPTQQGGGQAQDTSRMGNDPRYANCKTGADAEKSDDCARVAVENSLYNYWSGEFQASNIDFTPAKMMTFTGGTTTGCGSASSQMGPFYCPSDQTIYLDSTFFRDIYEGQLGGQGGAFVEPYVIAHEYGHHIQNLLGFMGKVRTQKGADSDAVKLELQADCFAGVWAKHAQDTDSAKGVQIFTEINQQDIDEALNAAKAVGDDRIQQKMQGQVNPEGWTHGSAEQRMRWFQNGFTTGDPDKCNTFEAASL